MNKKNITLREGGKCSTEVVRGGGGTRGLAVLLRAMEPLRPDSQPERDSVMIGSECMARRGVLQRARDELDSIVTSWPEAISITQLRSHTTVPWRQCVCLTNCINSETHDWGRGRGYRVIRYYKRLTHTTQAH